MTRRLWGHKHACIGLHPVVRFRKGQAPSSAPARLRLIVLPTKEVLRES
jgi:hypothetical protein